MTKVLIIEDEPTGYRVESSCGMRLRVAGRVMERKACRRRYPINLTHPLM